MLGNNLTPLLKMIPPERSTFLVSEYGHINYVTRDQKPVVALAERLGRDLFPLNLLAYGAQFHLDLNMAVRVKSDKRKNIIIKWHKKCLKRR
jgi:hypothetical protein